LKSPTAIIRNVIPINKYAGRLNILADSLIPLKLPTVINIIIIIVSSILIGSRLGIADVIAATPAVALTATVTM